MTDFASAYCAIRQKEGRVYSDEILAGLPRIARKHPLAQEWRIRAASLDRVLLHVSERGGRLRLLDLGCGNGWMSRHFAGVDGVTVTAVDRVPAALAQARRVFGHLENLTVLNADVFRDPLPAPEYDLIMLGASVQYFPDLGRLVSRLLELLARAGEIHIFDSPFYTAGEVAAARERSRVYYEKMGFPELAAYYHHHSIDELYSLGARCLYAPRPARRWTRLLGVTPVPFGWYCLSR